MLGGIVKQTPLRILMVGFLFLPILARSEVHAQEKIRIGFSTYSPGFLPTVIAEKKGFYAKYGLAPEHILIAISVGMNASARATWITPTGYLRASWRP